MSAVLLGFADRRRHDLPPLTGKVAPRPAALRDAVERLEFLYERQQACFGVVDRLIEDLARARGWQPKGKGGAR